MRQATQRIERQHAQRVSGVGPQQRQRQERGGTPPPYFTKKRFDCRPIALWKLFEQCSMKPGTPAIDTSAIVWTACPTSRICQQSYYSLTIRPIRPATPRLIPRSDWRPIAASNTRPPAAVQGLPCQPRRLRPPCRHAGHGESLHGSSAGSMHCGRSCRRSSNALAGRS